MSTACTTTSAPVAANSTQPTPAHVRRPRRGTPAAGTRPCTACRTRVGPNCRASRPALRAGRPCPAAPCRPSTPPGRSPRPSSRTSNVRAVAPPSRRTSIAGGLPRTWPRSAAPRGSRSTRRPRSPAGSGRRRRRRPSTGIEPTARLRLERRREALVRQQRRVDAAREVAAGSRSPRRPRRRSSPSISAARRGVLRQHPADQPQLDGQRDQVLLRAVVDVALEPPALGVLRRHDALARGAQLLERRRSRPAGSGARP